MKPINYEIRQHVGNWELLRDGCVVCVSLRRETLIDAIAAFHRSQIRQEQHTHLNLVGLTLLELRNSRVLDINWKRKGPRIEISRFDDAELHLNFVEAPSEAFQAIQRYHEAMDANRFNNALDQLVLLGDLMDCHQQYWQVLQEIVPAAWPSPHIVPNRKERGQTYTKIEFIERRAKGDRMWSPKLSIAGFSDAYQTRRYA